MRRFIMVLSLWLFLLACQQASQKSNVKILQSHRDQRVNTLAKNYKYQVLLAHGLIMNYEWVADNFDELRHKLSKDVEEVNKTINRMSEQHQISLLECKSKEDVDIFLLKNEILIYDHILSKTLGSMNPFENLQAEVLKVKDIDEYSEYKVFLSVNDSTFNPSVEVFMKKDTFLVEVKNEDYSILRMRKKSKTHVHSFKGDIIIGDNENSYRIPFSYPSPAGASSDKVKK
ncbi:MAG: hypothetical protein RIG77_04740 [Cyclobacteriaceae bacterium]